MSDVKELAERLRQFKEFQRGVKELTIPGYVSVALNLVTPARPEELTVRDLRESADLLEQQAKTIRRLLEGQAQASVVVSDLLRSGNAVYELKKGLKGMGVNICIETAARWPSDARHATEWQARLRETEE